MTTKTDARQNELVIERQDYIAIINKNGREGNWRWMNGSLVRGTGRHATTYRFSPELTAEINAAVAATKAARPAVIETLTGDKVAASVAAGASRQDEWGWSELIDDAVGLYSRTVQPAVKVEPVSVWFGRGDLV